MQVLFLSNRVSPGVFQSIFDMSPQKPGQQVQRFDGMMMKGLAENGCSVTALSLPPVPRAAGGRYLAFPGDFEGAIRYVYIPVVNLPVVKQIWARIAGFVAGARWARRTKGRDRIVICDALSPTLSALGIAISRFFQIKRMAVVTDLPSFLALGAEKERGIRTVARRLFTSMSFGAMKKYDLYMLLTDEMSRVVNPHNKPYIVIEGMVDPSSLPAGNDIARKARPPVILFAGALFEKYGLRMLAEGFLKSGVDAEMHFYGAGEMERELEALSRKYDNIRFFGVVPNGEILRAELSATLLVNPRFSHEEYTKYSFPSKNMEYMMSGTPVLTTALPGMPEEYRQYVYILENETAGGMAHALMEIMSKPGSKLHDTGLKAQRFVAEHKNYKAQMGKVAAFIKGNM